MLFVCHPKNLKRELLSVSLGAILTPKRNWRQCLSKILGWQTKRIMLCYDIFWSGQFFKFPFGWCFMWTRLLHYLLFSAWFALAMHQLLVNLHTLRIQFVQKKNEYNGIFCSGLLGERIQGCGDKREEIHLLKTNKQTNKKTITKTKNRKKGR